MDRDNQQIPNGHDLAVQIRELDQRITARQDEMAETQKEVVKSLNDISEALLGDRFNPRGLVKSVEDHELRLVSMERRIDRAIWLTVGTALGGGLAGGTLSAFLVKVFERGGG